jgi:murein DD-endopeptidase MepM/ murein hydrolase activator NlpD
MDATRRSFGRRTSSPLLTLSVGDGEHSLAIRPATLAATVAGVGIAVLATLAAAGYLAFHDRLVAAAFNRQAETEAAYEDRLAALRLQIDRLASRQVLDQDDVAERVEALARQHSALVATGARLADLLQKARAAGVAVPDPRAGAVGPAVPTGAAAKPIAASVIRGAALTGIEDPTTLLRRLDTIAAGAVDVDRQHAAVAAGLAENAAERVDLIEGTMAQLGVGGPRSKPVPPAARAASGAGVGGPYVAAESPEATIGRAAALLDRFELLKRRLNNLPLRRPIEGDLVITSPFGSRQDPFLGAPALHTGVDLRAEQGAPVLATAPGTVETTGRFGGYGLMVDIDHGNGVVTRYGHLSRIAVNQGTRIAAGDVIGYAGSTGRSTGPHLHYETRIAGEAVDPSDWLAAGERLEAFLN